MPSYTSARPYFIDELSTLRQNRGVLAQKPTKELKDSILSKRITDIIQNSKADIVFKDGKIRIFIKDDQGMFKEICFRVHQEKHIRPVNNAYNPYHDNTVNEVNYDMSRLQNLLNYLTNDIGYTINMDNLIALIQDPLSRWYLTEEDNSKYLQFSPTDSRLIEYNANGSSHDSFIIN